MNHKVFAVLALVCLSLSCNIKKSTSDTPSATSPLTGTVQGSVPSADQIRSMYRSEANPNLKLYKQWDLLLVEGIDNVSQGPDSEYDTWPQNGVLLSSVLDDKGFILPRAEMLRLSEKFRTDRDNLAKNPHDFGLGKTWVYAIVEMDETTRKAMDLADRRVALEFLPHFPKWLAERQYFAATVLPDSRVVLDLRDSPHLDANAEAHVEEHEMSTRSASHEGLEVRFELYNADGYLLSSTNSTEWWPLFGNDAPNGVKWNTSEQTPDGYWVLGDKDSKKSLAVLDFDGTQISSLTPPKRDTHLFSALPREAVLSFLSAQ